MIVRTNKGFFCDDKQILSRLWIANPAYISALKRWWFLGRIAKELSLYNEGRIEDKDGYVIKWGYVPCWVASFFPFDGWWNNKVVEFPELNGKLRENQIDIVDKLLSHRYAYGHISTGLGKTWILLEIARRLKRKTLIIVDWASALEQFSQDIKNIMGIDAYMIGKKKSIDSPIAITTIHSIHKIDVHSYGTILYDEADKYLGSEARRSTLCGISCEYAYAVTGTVKLNDIDDKVFPVFYGKKEELFLKNIKPVYTQIKTAFTCWNFDTFQDIESALYENSDRNALIVNETSARLKDGRAKKAIVFSKRIEHAKILEQWFIDKWIKTFLIIGAIKREERERIRQEIISYPWVCVLIGSVQCVGRGFDCPPLDLGVLTTAEKFSSNLTQYLGRIIRPHISKSQVEFIDFVDHLQPMLVSQSRKRLANFKKEFP